jgi:hypothetical protein
MTLQILELTSQTGQYGSKRMPRKPCASSRAQY